MFPHPDCCDGQLVEVILTRLTSDLRRRWSSWLRRRELAGTSRAGQFARDKVWDQHLAYARQAWPLLSALAVLVPLAFLPLAILSSGGVRWFIVGASSSSGLWLATLYLVVHAGMGPQVMSIVAEQRTVSELQALRRHGWQLVTGLRVGTEIDHVAVGPPGVVVLETKWAAETWPVGMPKGDAFLQDRLKRAAVQARANARDVRRHEYFRRVIGEAPVRPAVVVWSASPEPENGPKWVEAVAADNDRLTIVHGRHLGQWLLSLDRGALDSEGVVRVLVELIERADVVERSQDGARDLRPTLDQLVLRAAIQGPLGIVPAMYLFSGLAQLPAWGLAVGCATAIVLGVQVRRRVRMLRWVATGWLVAFVMITASVPVLVALAFLKD